MAGQKKYGLIIPKKDGKAAVATKKSIFDQSSDTEDVETSESANIILPTRKLQKDIRLKKQAQLDIEKALSEDPTVFDYDSVYDDMKATKESQIKQKKGEDDKKPKYIGNLLKAADQRKKEYERRMEKKIQVERENEKDSFKDKEQFVTSAYKKKMLEMQQAEEQERKQAALEAAMDVTKQRDLGNFYRHLWGEENGVKPAAAVISSSSNSRMDSSTVKVKTEPAESSRSRSDKSIKDEQRPQHKTKEGNRALQPGRIKEENNDGQKNKPSPLPTTQSSQEHAFEDDRDLSSSSASSDEESDEEQAPVSRKKSKSQLKTNLEGKDSRSKIIAASAGGSGEEKVKRRADGEAKADDADEPQQDEDPAAVAASVPALPLPLPQPAPKEDSAVKFAKRNVGDSVDDARARYLARKQNRQVPIASNSTD